MAARNGSSSGTTGLSRWASRSQVPARARHGGDGFGAQLLCQLLERLGERQLQTVFHCEDLRIRGGFLKFRLATITRPGVPGSI